MLMAEVVERWDELFGVWSLSLARGAKARIWQDSNTGLSILEWWPEPPLEERSSTLPQTEERDTVDSDTISNEGSHEHQRTVPSTAASTSRCRGPPPEDDLAPILASILDRQEQTLIVHGEAIGTLPSFAADVH
ncbi:UNVERIFIED_CONTAM: hypothetical protein FKN15_063596 [Acipenser sinensis]